MPTVKRMMYELCMYGGGITLDFAKKDVDYLVATGHYINEKWEKVNFVITFIPVPLGLVKSYENVKLLLETELLKLGITPELLYKACFCYRWLLLKSVRI